MRGQGLEVVAEVDKLLTTLASNRAKHLLAYEKAKKGWKKLVLKDIEKLYSDLEADKSIDGKRLYLKPKPTHFLHEYDEAMEMLKYSSSGTITLDQEHFRAYVKDEWNWKQQFSTSNSTYIAAGR